jgi:hypothetical protein
MYSSLNAISQLKDDAMIWNVARMGRNDKFIQNLSLSTCREEMN